MRRGARLLRSLQVGRNLRDQDLAAEGPEVRTARNGGDGDQPTIVKVRVQQDEVVERLNAQKCADAVEQIFHVKSIMSERSRKWEKARGLPGTCQQHDYASALCFASPVIAPSMLVAKLTNDVMEQHVVVESRMR